MVNRHSEPADILEEAMSLVEVLMYRASLQGSRTAFRYLSQANGQEKKISYAELDRSAREIAVQLLQRGKSGDPVVLLYPSSLEYVAAFMGCLYAGFIAVPLYPPRPNQKLYRAGKVIADCGCRIALTNTAALATVKAYLSGEVGFKQIEVLASDAITNIDADSWKAPLPVPESIAFLQYTSGSTGTPRGVMVSHASLMANQRTITTASGTNECDTFVTWLPIYHDMGLIGLLMDIFCGFETVVIPSTGFVRDPIWWLEMITRFGATLSGGPNFAYELCCDRITEQRLAGLDLSSWRLAFNGAEPVRPETLSRFAKTFEPAGFQPNVFWPCYGMAEATLFITAGNHASKPTTAAFEQEAIGLNRVVSAKDGQDGAVSLASCGSPQLSDRVVIVDPQTHLVVPEDGVGEIWVKSSGAASGYWQQPELTQETFAATLADSGMGPFLRTGDLGFLHRGELFITGRLKDLVILRGRNYYPQDLEHSAQLAHPALRGDAAAAFTVFRESMEQLVLVMEVARTWVRKLDKEQVFAAVRAAISEDHELQVSEIVLLRPGRILKTSSGKIQRRANKAAYLTGKMVSMGYNRLARGAASEPEPALDRKTVLAADKPEFLIANHLHASAATALAVDAVSFGNDTPLNALGISSMAAISLQHSLEADLGVTLPIEDLLTGKSVAQLATICWEQLYEAEPKTQTENRQQDAFPLSPNQQAIWHYQRLDPESAAYNLPYAVRFRMPLDVAFLKASFATLVERHRLLRAVVEVDGAQVLLRINQGDEPAFREIDASAWSEEEVRDYLEGSARQPFDLTRGPLLRLDLLACGDNHILMINMFHLVGDMWSLLVLLDELRLLYSARGQYPMLDPLELEYAHFAAESRSFAESVEGALQWAYWQNRLSGDLPVLELPTDRPRPARLTSRGASWSFGLESSGIQQLATAKKTTPFTVLLATFQVLLHRYSGGDDILVGIPDNGRIRAGYRNTVGYFVNPLVMRAVFEGQPRFNEFLEQTRRDVMDGMAAAGLPFQVLLERLEMHRDPSRTPLFQVMFAHQEPHQLVGMGSFALRQAGASLQLGELSLESVAFEPGTAQFDLALFTAETQTGLAARFEYNRDLFDESTITRLAVHFQDLLTALIAAPHERINRLSPISESERQELMVAFCDTEQPLAQEAVHIRFLEMVAQYPNAIAVSDETTQLTYAQLEDRALRLAAWLRSCGAGPEQCVGLCFRRSTELVEAALGVLLTGATYVPLDPAYPAERLAFMQEDSGMLLLLTTSSENPRSSVDLCLLDKQRAHFETRLSPDRDYVAERAAYLIYTSGSTGLPKGVCIPHRGLANLVAWHQRVFAVERTDRAALTAGTGFDASVWEIWPYLSAGAALLVLPESLAAEPAQLRDWLLSEEITLTFLATPLAEAVLSLDWPVRAPLRFLLTGGDKLKAFPPRGLPFTLVNNYGPTENAVVATAARLDPAPGLPPIGKPIDNVQVYVLDRFLEPVPIGAPGELCLAGESLARGYLGHPALSAERFVPNPFRSQSARLYRTGDRVRFSHDLLHFLGRVDHQVKLRGFRIELGEIEHALTALDGTSEALVLLREDQPGEPRLVAYHTGNARPPAELRADLALVLPAYMVPTAYVALERLPLTANGKINRRALAAPGREHLAVSMDAAPPRTPAEIILHVIWCELMHLEDIGIHDNFFELGGDSIIAIQVITRARKQGLSLAAGDLYNHQTIARLALAVGTTEVFGREPVIGPVMASPIQQWFLDRRLTDAAHFNQSVLLEIESGIAPALIRDSLDLLHEHHDALRLRFASDGSIFAARKGGPRFEAIPVGPNPASLVENKTAELQAALNPTSGPLMAAALFLTPAEVPDLLFITIHHLVVDGISWRILLEDLVLALKGFSGELPARTTSLAAWNARLREGSGDLSYWLNWPDSVHVAGQPSKGETRPSLVGQTETIAQCFEPDFTRSLLQQPASIYRMGIKEVLLAALARALADLDGHWDLILDSEGHGREPLFSDADLSRTVGWFTSLYPIRLQLDAGGNCEDDLIAVKEQLSLIPDGGVYYGLSELNTRSLVLFNYLGRFDGTLQAPLLRRSDLATGPDRSPRGERAHLLEIDVVLLNDRLQLDWTYSRVHYHREKIETLMASFNSGLNKLWEHCRQLEVRRYTPSDFPFVDMNLGTLDGLLADEPRISDIYRLTPVQEGMLFHALLHEDSPAYFEQLTACFAGDLESDAFKKAWLQVIRGNPVLSSCFRWENLVTPIQMVIGDVEPEWQLSDLSKDSAIDQGRAIETYLNSDRERSFDLSQAPLCRFALFRTGPSGWSFVWSYHHLLLDGWSLSLVLDEVFGAYRAIKAGTRMVSAERTLFKTFVNASLDQVGENAQDYWRRQLAGFETPLLLPGTRQTDQASTAHVEGALSEASFASLDNFARSQGLTLSTCIQGAWAVLLSRYCRTDDVVFGLTVSGRDSGLSGVEGIIGLLINTLPVRVRFAPDQNVGEWLQQVQESNRLREPHAGTPLARIQTCSELEGGTGLFETLLVVENYPLDAAFLQRELGFVFEDVGTVAFTQYALTLVARTHEGLSFQVAYDTSRFKKAAAERLLVHLVTVLAALPNESCRDRLPMLAENERSLLLRTWNQLPRTPLPAMGIHQRFEACVAQHPDREALYLPQARGARRKTYRELELASNRLAHYLRRRGAGPETLIGLHVDRSIELVIGILGILKAGAAYVPMDPVYPNERLAFMIEDARLDLMICQTGMGENLGPERINLDETSLFADQATHSPAQSVHSRQTAYVIYTSGSTGKPKGVPVAHGNIVRLFQATQGLFNFGPSDTWTLFHSYAFDFTVWELWGALTYGGRLVVVPVDVARSAEAFHDLLCEQSVTVLNQTPSAFVRLIQAGEGKPKTRLRHVIFGGEALEPSTLIPWFERYGDSEPQLTNMYGITETTVHVTYRTITAEDTLRPGSNVGVRLPHLRLFLLGERLEPAPLGCSGEIYVGGAGVARGYLHRPSLTATRFLPDPFGHEPGARLYRSGDLGHFGESEGAAIPSLEYAGRCDFQVKIRGFRIELGEIEASLTALEGVRDAAVLVREDLPGLAGKQLVAYLVTDWELTVDSLHERLRKALPDYMVPGHFVFLAELPLTAHGKVDRRGLPLPSETSNHDQRDYVAPRDPVEQKLADIWAEVLGQERVGIHDRFFELGGDSILSIRIMTAAKAQGLELSLAQLFEFQTIEKLAPLVKPAVAPIAESTPFAQLSEQERSAVPEGVVDAYPATRLQNGMLFHGEMEEDAYHNLSGFQLRAHYNEDELRSATQQLTFRHPVLRTAFDLRHFSQPMQLVYEQITTPVFFADLSHLSPEDQARELESWREAEKQNRFDSSQPGLLRFHFHRLAEDRFAVTLTEHHAILDGWSVAILFSELFTLYFTGQAASIPAARFSDYVALEKEALIDEQDGRYWADRLDGFEFTRIPRQAGDDADAAHLEIPIEEPLSNSLKRLAQQTEAPLKSVLLAVHLRILALLSGNSDVVSGLVSNGRPEHGDSERTLGLFLNTLPFRYCFAGESWRDLIGAVFAAERETLPHRRYPLSEMQKMFSGKELFETAFNYTAFPTSIDAVDGLTVEQEYFHAPTHFPFAANFGLDGDSGRVQFSLDYRADVFPHHQVAAIAAHYLTALGHLVQNLDASCRRMAFLAGEERQKVLRTWNQTHVDHQPAIGLHHLVQAQARRTPQLC